VSRVWWLSVDFSAHRNGIFGGFSKFSLRFHEAATGMTF
jgi:hypothetical protein